MDEFDEITSRIYAFRLTEDGRWYLGFRAIRCPKSGNAGDITLETSWHATSTRITCNVCGHAWTEDLVDRLLVMRAASGEDLSNEARGTR
jgi:hypothetical protein